MHLHVLLLVMAKVQNGAFIAFGFAGEAGVAAMEDEPVMGVHGVFGGDDFFQLRFDLVGCRAGGHAGAV